MRRVSRRKARQEPPETVAESVPEVRPAETVSSAESASTADPRRLTVTLTESGDFDYDSMRAKTRERLRSAIERSAPVVSQKASTATSLFDESLCLVLYDALGSVAIALARKRGFPMEQAQTLAFTENEKKALAPLTSKVLDKWIPNSGKYNDEAMLALALFGVVSAKIALLRKPAQVIPHVVPQAVEESPAS